MGRLSLYSIILALFAFLLFSLQVAIWGAQYIDWISVNGILDGLTTYMNILIYIAFVMLAVDSIMIKYSPATNQTSIHDVKKHPKISIAIPAYNEEKSIGKVVRDFKKLNVADEIIVIDNNSKDRTSLLAKNAGARVVLETKQGYGFACRRGLEEAKGDIIVLVEADDTFEAKDIYKFLTYLESTDIVLGTRTTLELVSKDAQMDIFLRWGNTFIAKLLQLRFRGNIRLTDVGCTYKAIRKDALDKIIGKVKTGKSDFSPEMIIRALDEKLKVIEVPIHYKKRVGESKITGNRWRAFKLGIRMIWLILTN